MNSPFPNPSPFGAKSPFSGPSLLDRYKGKPVGEIRFPTAAAPQRPAVDPDYLAKTRENDPWPEGSSCAPPSDKPPAATNSVVLSNCRFLTPTEQLRFNEAFEMAVDVRRTAPGRTRRAFFDLHQSWIRDGVPEEQSIVRGIEGFPDSDGETHTVKAKDVLETAMPYVLGETIEFWLTATHQEAAEPATSPRVKVALKTHAHWVGGGDIHFGLDGEFPFLGSDGSLVSVLATALKRTAKPPEPDRPESTICFGFASSSGDPDHNRELSRRRAKVVKAILARDEKSWEALAKANFRTEDLQQFLADLAAYANVPCDPGPVDGVAGKQTSSAVETFQNHANGSWNLGLTVDGKCGPKTWNAILRQILALVQSAMGADPGKAPDWKIPLWGRDGDGTFGNGEDFASAEEDPDQRSVQIMFFAGGSEPILVDPPAKAKVTVQENPVEDKGKTSKTKLVPDSDKNSTPSDDTILFFVPGRSEYWELSSKEADDLFPYLKEILGLQKEIADYRDQLQDPKTMKSAMDKGVALSEKISEKFKETANATPNSIQELLLIADNVKYAKLPRRLYINPTETSKRKVKGHWRSIQDKDAEKRVRKWWGGAPPKLKDEFKTNLKGVLWQSEKIDTTWPWDWKVGNKSTKGGEKSDYWEASAESQFFRFVAGAAVDGEFSLSDKKIKFSAHGDVSYSLAEGKANGAVFLPEKKGFDLFSLLQPKDKSKASLIKNNRQLWIRIKFELDGKAFVGASASAAISFPVVDWSKTGKTDAYGEAEADAFAGASAEGKLAASAEWKPHDGNSFEGLAALQAVAAGRAGAGIGLKAVFGYKDGKFRVEFAAMVVVGLGGKLGAAFEVGIDQGVKLVGYILDSVDHHYVEEIMGDAYQALSDWSLAQLATIEAGVDSAVKATKDALSDFESWVSSALPHPGIPQMKKAITAKAVSKSPQPKTSLDVATPEALAKSLRIILTTFESSDYEAILSIIHSGSAHKTRWVLRNLAMPGSSLQSSDPELINQGIRKLKAHGKDVPVNFGYAVFQTSLDLALASKGIYIQ
ncbi:MAG: peptidoglycan-binding protein [Fibrobacteria bacterium]|nr:peptidoglycan-binding protein [Fibrobacteria bacterium]